MKKSMLCFVLLASAFVSPASYGGMVPSIIGFAVKRLTHSSTDGDIAQGFSSFLMKPQSNRVYNTPPRLVRVAKDPISNINVYYIDVDGVIKPYVLRHHQLISYRAYINSVP